MTCRRKKTLKKHQGAYIPYFFIVLYSNVLLLQSSVWVFHILLESLKNKFTWPLTDKSVVLSYRFLTDFYFIVVHKICLYNFTDFHIHGCVFFFIPNICDFYFLFSHFLHIFAKILYMPWTFTKICVDFISFYLFHSYFTFDSY